MLVREAKKDGRRKRGQITLVFDPTQKVPDHVLMAIIEDWLVPCLVEEFSSKIADGLRCTEALRRKLRG